ncbi:MAG TPA: hypothetical protein VNU72_12155 [Puia sp.]|jgi:hypothetical protein|nr:hypothetical protein [Puia sp.]
MRSLSLIITVISLLMIAYQDFRSRSVHWIYFPLLALSGMGMAATLQSFLRILADTGFNLAFMGLQLVLLKLYFFVRCRVRYTALTIAQRRSTGSPDTALIDKKIGLGDILFLAATCLFFSPINFIAFYILSLLFAIGTWLLMDIIGGRRLQGRRISGARQTTVPLAGLQASFLLLTLCAASWWNYSLSDDGQLILKISHL